MEGTADNAAQLDFRNGFIRFCIRQTVFPSIFDPLLGEQGRIWEIQDHTYRSLSDGVCDLCPDGPSSNRFNCLDFTWHAIKKAVILFYANITGLLDQNDAVPFSP